MKAACDSAGARPSINHQPNTFQRERPRAGSPLFYLSSALTSQGEHTRVCVCERERERERAKKSFVHIEELTFMYVCADKHLFVLGNVPQPLISVQQRYVMCLCDIMVIVLIAVEWSACSFSHMYISVCPSSIRLSVGVCVNRLSKFCKMSF